MTIEEYLNKPYWVIDILPKQVPADGRGQYFRIEKYFLEHPQIDNIYRKFTNILLKLNCYEDIEVSHDGDEWITNPAPHELETALLGCMADKQTLYIILESADVLITVSGDDTYMTVYNPTEEAIELIGSLAGSEGMAIWQPNNI
ncbi:hypothetical protein [Prevotella sp. lc2012]|jgi:hypothetical protein|uniref:hypothetical protein n=1 Tax=Prevotella sp. lc2012 TaxID=1761886 RepID=UPI00089ACF5A|nr:hypothetical protein [Prevotella sp. lc2012]SEE00578.1 hypothetical protein SAMN04487828_0146 [Prevotella sp. lc2012]